MPRSYDQICEALRGTHYHFSQKAIKARALITKLISPFGNELNFPKEAINYYRKNSDGTYTLANDLNDVHLFTDGFFHVGIGLNFQAPGQERIQGSMMLKVKVGCLSDAFTFTVEGTPIYSHVKGLNDGQAIGSLLQQLAKLIEGVFSESLDEFFAGRLQESHPAHQAIKRLLENHTDELRSPKLKAA